MTELDQQFNPLNLDLGIVLYSHLKEYEYWREKYRLVFENPLEEWKQLNPGKSEDLWDGSPVDVVYKSYLDQLRVKLMDLQRKCNAVEVPFQERFIVLLIGYIELKPYGFLDMFLRQEGFAAPDLPSYSELLSDEESRQLLNNAFNELAQYGEYPIPSVESPVNMQIEDSLSKRILQASTNIENAIPLQNK